MRSQGQTQRNSDSGDTARGHKSAGVRQPSTADTAQPGMSLAEAVQSVQSVQSMQSMRPSQLAYSPAAMFQLQRAIGNAAVSRLVTGAGQGPAEAPVQRSLVPGVLSSPGTPLAAPVRAGTDNGSGLSVSDPGDRYEREAEANAARVMAAAPTVSDATQDTGFANPGLQSAPTASSVQTAASVQTAPSVQRAPATATAPKPAPAHHHAMPRPFPRRGRILAACKGHLIPPIVLDDGTTKPASKDGLDFGEKEMVNVPDYPSPNPDWICVVPANDPGGQVYWVKKSDVKIDAGPIAKDFSQTPMGADEAKPNDVAQGQIGDCYLMAALAAVALQHPHYIDGMIRQGSTGVQVRFHRKSGGQKGTRPTFTAEWIDVDTRLFAKPNDTKPLYAGAHKSLWPAIIEKAYAVFKGRGQGYEGIGHGGRPKFAFEAVLGVEAGSHEIGPFAVTKQDAPNPFAITDEQFVHPFAMDEGALVSRVGLTAAQAKSFHTRSRQYSDRKAVTAKSPHAYTDIALVLGCASDPAAKSKLRAYSADHLEEPLKSGKYSASAEHVWNKIQAKFLAGEMVVLSSKTWGSRGEGHSAGEDIKVVPGIAATHAYTVMGVHSEMDKASGKEIKYVTVRNPWGVFGRGYTSSWNPLTLGAQTGVRKPEGTFHLELTDLMRYFTMADHAPAPAAASTPASGATATP